MAKTEPKIDIAANVSELHNQLRDIQTEHAKLTDQIERAEQQRTGAKTDYEQALSVGDEKSMAEALATIRQAVADIPHLQSERVALSGGIEEIGRHAHQILSLARERLAVARQHVTEAHNRKEAATCDESRGMGLLGFLNETRRLVGSEEPEPASKAAE